MEIKTVLQRRWWHLTKIIRNNVGGVFSLHLYVEEKSVASGVHSAVSANKTRRQQNIYATECIAQYYFGMTKIANCVVYCTIYANKSRERVTNTEYSAVASIPQHALMVREHFIEFLIKIQAYQRMMNHRTVRPISIEVNRL